ncbi:hypothetical protein [Allohahella marinimesophila]|uniref:Inclusion body protein n=1 Tax=Allohahella marinimesophila TaxID=1054972 RepID=A0ABP7QAU9_9GAMM
MTRLAELFGIFIHLREKLKVVGEDFQLLQEELELQLRDQKELVCESETSTGYIRVASTRLEIQMESGSVDNLKRAINKFPAAGMIPPTQSFAEEVCKRFDDNESEPGGGRKVKMFTFFYSERWRVSGRLNDGSWDPGEVASFKVVFNRDNAEVKLWKNGYLEDTSANGLPYNPGSLRGPFE